MKQQNPSFSLILFVGCIHACSPVSAEGFYLGSEVGMSVTSREIVSSGLEDGSDPGVGISFYGGYDINRKFSVEVSIQSDAVLLDSSNICYTNAGLSALYYSDLSAQFLSDNDRIYGRVGLHTPLGMSGNREHHYDGELFPSVGVGIERQLNNGLTLRGEGQIIGSESTRVTLGVLKRFGDSPSSSKSPAMADNNTQPAIGQSLAPPITQLTGIEEKSIIELVDSDNDGVMDTDDRCRNTQQNTRVSDNGCIYLDNLLGINFALGSTGLTDETASVLDLVATELKNNPELAIVVEGHTDSLGSSGFNRVLSLKRAKSVRDYMIDNHSVNKSRFTVAGLGDQQPVRPNDSKKNRFANRRVVFRIAD